MKTHSSPTLSTLGFAAALVATKPLQAATVTWEDTAGFTALSSYQSLGEWNTNGDAEGWVASNFATGPTIATGTVSGTSGSPPTNLAAVDPFYTRNGISGINLDSGNFDIVEFRLRVGDGITVVDNARIDFFWGTSNNGGISGTRRIAIENSSLTGWNGGDEGNFKVYQINMAGTANWDGNLTNVRLDPISGTVANGQANQPFSFDYVRIGVPEPSVFLLSALGGLITLRRRRT